MVVTKQYSIYKTVLCIICFMEEREENGNMYSIWIYINTKCKKEDEWEQGDWWLNIV